jgi:hypothetical protein
MGKPSHAYCISSIRLPLIGWYSKKQATAETATYGAEELAGWTAIEQCRDNRLTFLYIGVPIDRPSILLEDNESVVKGVTTYLTGA